ncbi:MAG: heme peroxidase family protein [Bryobacteraceae bacterium]|nr:heme peroxidase family protein [Bryobacteraceae bacterium]
MTGAAPAAKKVAFHGAIDRLYYGVPQGPFFKPGMFGRMFPRLSALTASNDAMVELGSAMVEEGGQINDPAFDNPTIPAGFTYLGQFIDHDITFDTTPLPEIVTDPQAIHNFRTPKLDLDSLYGGGPGAQPYLYTRANDALFVIGTNRESPDQNGVNIPALPNDLPRNAEGFALIGDKRNDENLLVAQLHLAMLKFHNKVVTTRNVGFDEARRIVTWHYQWMVIHDFLARLVSPAVLNDVLANGRKFFTFQEEAFMPVEFSVAAYRLGHSMVRDDYFHNRVFNPTSDRLAPGSLSLLFRFTGLSGSGGDVPVPTNWIIDWRRFFEFAGLPADFQRNHSRLLDTKLAATLGNLPIPDPEKRLAVRNLIRGVKLGLPSGQAIAAAMGITPLTPSEVASGSDAAIVTKHGFDTKTPLWYYILKEAEVRGAGRRLGPVGSRIVAETFIGLLDGDANSFRSQDPTFTPDLPSATPGQFTMVDLLNFVGEVNPIG